jgi:hypothetical protein
MTNLFTSKAEALTYHFKAGGFNVTVYCRDTDGYAHTDDTVACSDCGEHQFKESSLDDRGLCEFCAHDVDVENDSRRRHISSCHPQL